uniref:Uncharacterized protein n=1 Tax=Salix viminalis TaxID=40686 RepID=A0A6N2KUB2_SALVM
MAHENQDPWFIKLYKPTSSKDNNYGASITTSTHYSNYSKVLVTYEVTPSKYLLNVHSMPTMRTKDGTTIQVGCYDAAIVNALIAVNLSIQHQTTGAF